MNRIIHFAVDRPWWALAMVVVVALALAFPILNLRQETDFREFLSDNDEIIKLMDEAEKRYGRTMGILVMVRNVDGIYNPATLAKIEEMTERIEPLVGVKAVTSPLNAQVITGTESTIKVRSASPGGAAPTTTEELEAFRARVEGSRMLEGNVVSSDGRAASISVELELDADEYAITPEIVEIVRSLEGDGDEIYIYGDAYFDTLMTEEMETDLNVLFPLALLLMVVVLFISFVTVRGVLVPIAVVVLSVIVAMGIMSLVGFPMTMVSFIAPVLLLAIGIADGIHVLNRYNEETAKGTPKREAILKTMEDMKGPVVMTSLTTAVGFLSLLSSFFLPQKQFGVVTAIGVLAAMVFSLVLIPAVMSLLKPPRVRDLSKGLRPLTRVLLGFERLVIRFRRVVLIVALGVLAFMVAGIPMLDVETSNEEFLGKDHPAIRILTFVDEHFSGGMQIQIEIETYRAYGLEEPEILHKMMDLEAFLRSQGVVKTISLTDVVREMNQRFHADDPTYYAIPDDAGTVGNLMWLFTGDTGDMANSNSSAGTIVGLYPMDSSGDVSRLARAVQGYLDEQFTGDVEARMIGATVLMDRLFTRMTQSQLLGLGTTLVAVTALVSLLMGSVIAGLIAAIPLLLTVAFSMGIMAYTGQPLDVMTLMVSAIAVGIGVDYSIHFISRFRREYRAHRDATRSLQATIRSTGRGITYNALTVALGFFILVFASFKGIRMFGLQIALTMIVSALSAISIIPAILTEWTPRFLESVPWARRTNGNQDEEPQVDTHKEAS
ncbi:MAG: RND family transporter [Candidatus Bipolaricaulota bacterium]|nr:MAG: RND family transporter [Candidatus Bipolaricaulota bacterium]